jgi:hypothetical protein
MGISKNSTFVIPAQARTQRNKPLGLLAALALRASLRLFNALRAFVPPARE